MCYNVAVTSRTETVQLLTVKTLKSRSNQSLNRKPEQWEYVRLGMSDILKTDEFQALQEGVCCPVYGTEVMKSKCLLLLKQNTVLKHSTYKKNLDNDFRWDLMRTEFIFLSLFKLAMQTVQFSILNLGVLSET